MLPTRLPAFCTLLLVSLPAWAEVVSLPKTSDEIRIDGVMNEPAWQLASRVSLDFETRPGENIPARVQTTAWLIEDGKSLYIAFDARDPDPAAIRAFLRDRDSVFRNDIVGVVLDLKVTKTLIQGEAVDR